MAMMLAAICTDPLAGNLQETQEAQAACAVICGLERFLQSVA